MKQRVNDYGVSPVVGVMLMLVVTIIIAAVVSSFAGGFGKTSDKSPSMTFDGEFSISRGVTLTHTGGDVIATRHVIMQMRPGTGFSVGTYAASVVNKSTITSSGGVTAGGTYAWGTWLGGNGGLTSWSPGDTVYIFPPYHNGTWLQPGQSSFVFANTANIGKTVVVELIDDKGHLFARSEIPIIA